MLCLIFVLVNIVVVMVAMLLLLLLVLLLFILSCMFTCYTQASSISLTLLAERQHLRLKLAAKIVAAARKCKKINKLKCLMHFFCWEITNLLK